MKKPRQRKPRFKRSPDHRNLVLKDRDLEILQLLGEHRLLQSHHFTQLVEGSNQHVVRRLGRLFHGGLIERPGLQRFATKLPEKTMVYSLSAKGLNLLKSNSRISPKTIPRLRAKALAHSLVHDLFVSEVMVQIRILAKANGVAFEWLHKRDDTNLFGWMKWGCRISHEGKQKYCSVIPDSAFILTPKDGKPSVFFLEYDRGTMPVRRRNIEQTSFYRKILAYKETRKGGILFKKHDLSGFRILVVTESRLRKSNLEAEVAKAFRTGKTTMFVFLNSDEIDSLFLPTVMR